MRNCKCHLVHLANICQNNHCNIRIELQSFVVLTMFDIFIRKYILKHILGYTKFGQCESGYRDKNPAMLKVYQDFSASFTTMQNDSDINQVLYCWIVMPLQCSAGNGCTRVKEMF